MPNTRINSKELLNPKTLLVLTLNITSHEKITLKPNIAETQP